MDYAKTKRKVKLKKYLIELMYLALGCLIMAIGTSLFLLPNQLSSGGFSGIATIFYYLFEFPLGITILVLNIPFFIWAFFKVGKKLLIKSIIGTVLLSTFIDLLDQVPLLTQDRFLACIYGGICIGLGLALVLKSGSSTGGTDLITYIAKAYKPYIRTSSLIVIIDIIIIGLNVFFFKKIEVGLYSAIAIYLMGKMIDIVFEGVNFSKLVFIITDMDKPILRVLNKELNMGVTEIYGKGAYSEKEKKIIMTAINRREIQNLREKIYSLDKHAFLVVTDAREVYGLGFKSLD